MMASLSATWLAAPLAAALIVATVFANLRAIQRRRLTKEAGLQEAVYFLHTHQASLKEFCALDQPESLQVILINFSRALSARDGAKEFVTRLVQVEKTGSAFGPDVQELSKLRENWPGQAQLFNRVIVSGLMAVFYRWPEVGEMLSTYVAHLAVDQEAKVPVVVRTTAEFSGDIGVGPMRTIPA